MCGGGENREMGEGIARISEFDPESYVELQNGVTSSEMHFREDRVDREELSLDAGSPGRRLSSPCGGTE